MKHMKKLVGLGAVIYGAVGAKIFLNVGKPKTASHEKAQEYDMNKGSYTSEFPLDLNKEEVIIKSEKGYDLYGWWIQNDGVDQTIILVHGITSNIYGTLKYAQLYIDQGFNVLLYDHRNHGKSGGKNTTLGYHEREDLETCVQWVRKQVGETSVVGTHGESMGGATVIQHAGIYDSVDFVVSDCPFADLNKQVKDVIRRDEKLPLWVGIPGASLISKVTGNGWYGQSSPIKAIKTMTMPLLIIHGDADTYITPNHAQELYDEKIIGYRRLYFAKNADHAESIIKDRENYYRVVGEFLEEIGQKK